MNTNMNRFLISALSCLTLLAFDLSAQDRSPPVVSASYRVDGDITHPNIIYIMADDLGYGHLGSYGQEKINTSQLDFLEHLC